MKLQAGDHIGHYTVTRELGHGGMSQVYLARDDSHDRDVVLKFPNDEMLGDPASYERFQREVKIGNILTHPNIQKLYELAGDRMEPYLVLEFVPGETLRDFFRKARQTRTAPGQIEALALSLVTQVGSALAYSHANGVFHRDLKPENIIVTPDETAKVMDFGIAFMEGARRITWGPLSSQVGTPDYMAPEQIKGQRGDDRTDVYALGMILYECLAGRMPYEGDNALAVMSQHVNVSAPPLHEFYPEVSSALEEVILKAVRRKPESRWPSAQAFVDALTHLDGTDTGALKMEREQEENDQTGRYTSHNELDMPWWKVGLIVCASLFVLGLLTLLFQFAHRGH